MRSSSKIIVLMSIVSVYLTLPMAHQEKVQIGLHPKYIYIFFLSFFGFYRSLYIKSKKGNVTNLENGRTNNAIKYSHKNCNGYQKWAYVRWRTY